MQHLYFAASNSAEGFKNYYPQVFDRADRLYVIKGGPGTGKSGLMKKAALAAERRGYTVESYACSSDPTSLDGMLILTEQDKIGILDGTLPHAWEPKNPGAREEILNLGQFWDPKLLRRQKNEIFTLSNKKSTAYNRAYDYLRSCGNLCAVTDSLLHQTVDLEKMQGAAERLLRLIGLSKGSMRAVPALTRAIGMTGDVRLHSFEENARTVYRVGMLYGIERLFLDALGEQLKGKEVSVRFSFDPVSPQHLDGIFIEDRAVAIVLSQRDEGEEGAHFINPKRFANAERLREMRSELRYAARLYDHCLDGALHALSEVRIYHFLLEDIYKNAMDFKALNLFTEQFFASEINWDEN